MKNKDEIEQLFHEKFKNFEPMIPKELSEKIEIEAKKRVKINQFKKWGTITSFTILSILSTIYLIININSSAKKSPSAKTNKTDQNISLITEKINSELYLISDSLDSNENITIEIPDDVYEEEYIHEKREQEIQIDTLEINDIPPSKVEIKSTVYNINSTNTIPRYPNTDLGNALYSIEKLKKGALLVRLKTKQNTINELNKRGYFEKAKQVELELKSENIRIYKSFKENFNFCDLYFFYSNDTKNVLDKNFNGIFLNSDLQIDNTILPNFDYFLIAEFGKAKSTDFQPEKNDNINQNYGLLSRVIIINNSKMEQMKSPFPYYQKALSTKKDDKNIAKWNQKLVDFYEKRSNY